MQINFIDITQLADTLEHAERLQTIDHDGQLVHILSFGGSDLIAVVNPITGGASCIYSCQSFDAESGGSIHDQARALFATLP